MKLINMTERPARLLRNISPRDDRMMGCVIARALYDVGPSGELSVAGEKWPVDPAPADTPLGKKPGDKPFYMGGVDVLVGGRVYQPERKERERLSIEIAIGPLFRRRIEAIGDRRWIRAKDGSLVPSAPLSFSSMRLDYELAFGGRAPLEPEQSAPYGPNPRGKGYFLDEASAEGGPLPNLEDPSQLVQRWEDRPTPVGLGYYPEDGSLRPRSAINHPGLSGVIGSAERGKPAPQIPQDLSITVDHLTPALFNQGHPSMVIPAERAPKPGDRVVLTHGRKDGGDLSFLLPSAGFHLHVQLEGRERLIPLHLDQIGLLAGDARVLLSHRVVFEYRVVRHERRVCSLYEGPAPEEIPPHYRRDLRDEWDDDRFGEEALG